ARTTVAHHRSARRTPPSRRAPCGAPHADSPPPCPLAVLERVERDRKRNCDAAVDLLVGVAREVEDVLVAQLELAIHVSDDVPVGEEVEVVRNRDPAA